MVEDHIRIYIFKDPFLHNSSFKNKVAVLKALLKRCITHYLSHIKDMSPYESCYQGAYLFMMLCCLNSSAFAALVFAALASLQNAQEPVKFLNAASWFRHEVCNKHILCSLCSHAYTGSSQNRNDMSLK